MTNGDFSGLPDNNITPSTQQCTNGWHSASSVYDGGRSHAVMFANGPVMKVLHSSFSPVVTVLRIAESNLLSVRYLARRFSRSVGVVA